MGRAAAIAGSSLVVLLGGAASAHGRGTSGFVPVLPTFIAQCRSTARAVGYPVPCPTRVPPGFAAHQDGATPGCRITIVCPGQTRLWHGWVVGDSASAAQHLIITASPRPLSNDAKVVNGPAWYPAARVRPLGRVVINGRRMHAVFVPPGTNDGSAFSSHVVLVWTAGRHTYAFGFHDLAGIRPTLLLDEELARYLVLVGP